MRMRRDETRRRQKAADGRRQTADSRQTEQMDRGISIRMGVGGCRTDVIDLSQTGRAHGYSSGSSHSSVSGLKQSDDALDD